MNKRHVQHTTSKVLIMCSFQTNKKVVSSIYVRVSETRVQSERRRRRWENFLALLSRVFPFLTWLKCAKTFEQSFLES